MRTLLMLSALAVLAPSLAGSQVLPPGLPGMSQEPAPAQEQPIPRPDAMRVLAELGPELRLSSRQEERISAAVEKKGREFDTIFEDYDKAAAEEKKWRFKVNELKYRLNSVNRSIPDAVRDFLDDEQRQNFDAMLEARRGPKTAAPPEMKPGAVPAPAADTGRPARKKRLIKRRKTPRPAADVSDVPGAAGAATEEAAGMTMVDKDSAPEAVPAPRTKRVLKKKQAEPGAQAKEPAAQEAPAVEDAASYP